MREVGYKNGDAGERDLKCQCTSRSCESKKVRCRIDENLVPESSRVTIRVEGAARIMGKSKPNQWRALQIPMRGFCACFSLITIAAVILS